MNHSDFYFWSFIDSLTIHSCGKITEALKEYLQFLVNRWKILSKWSKNKFDYESVDHHAIQQYWKIRCRISKNVNVGESDSRPTQHQMIEFLWFWEWPPSFGFQEKFQWNENVSQVIQKLYHQNIFLDSNVCDLDLFPQSKLSVTFSNEFSFLVSWDKLIRNLDPKLPIFKSV